MAQGHSGSCQHGHVLPVFLQAVLTHQQPGEGGESGDVRPQGAAKGPQGPLQLRCEDLEWVKHGNSRRLANLSARQKPRADCSHTKRSPVYCLALARPGPAAGLGHWFHLPGPQAGALSTVDPEEWFSSKRNVYENHRKDERSCTRGLQL